MPARQWRQRFERFDRRLGFALGAVVGFILAAGGAAQSLEASGVSIVTVGVVGAAVLGVLVAKFGDRVLLYVVKLFS